MTGTDPRTDPETRIRETLATSSSLVLGDWDEQTRSALGGYNSLPVTERATLAHLHGRHDDSELPTMHCVLCEAFRPPGAAHLIDSDDLRAAARLLGGAT